MKSCLLCLFPRDQENVACDVCGHGETLTGAEEVPHDFALQMWAEGRLDIAVRFLEERVAKDEATAADCLHLAWISLTVQDYRAVETWCHESMRLDVASPDPHVLLGRVFECSERWQEAVEEYAAALRRAGLNGERRRLVEMLRAYCQGRIPEW